MIVTNVPGPQIPLYTLGSQLVDMFPQVPLLENTGLGVALFSYNGRMCWGFNADPALVPDISEFVRMVRNSFQQFADVAGVRLSDEDNSNPAAITPVEESARTSPDTGNGRQRA